MGEYTFENLIINPETPGLENLIGKEVYFDDVPIHCIKWANEDYEVGILKDVRKDNPAPFFVETSSGCMLNYPCIVPKKEEPYSERAKKWIKENGLKKGDYVKVVRKAKDYEDGWDSRWTKERDDFIGKVIPVSDIGESTGVILSYCCCDWAGYDFPYFVLEKTEPPKPEFVPFASADEFLDEYDNANYSINSGTLENKLLNYGGVWLKSKKDYSLCMVAGVRDDGLVICDKERTTSEPIEYNVRMSWAEVLANFVFLDGLPCGMNSLRRTDNE